MAETPAPPHMFDDDTTPTAFLKPDELPYAADLTTRLPYAESELRERIALAVGYASACWENLAGAGVFESDRARACVDDLTANVIRLTRLGEAHLGCATTAELREELEARERLGHTADDYRTADDS